MKLAVAMLMGALASWALTGVVADASGQRSTRISIASSVVDVRESRDQDVRSDILLLWNRDIRSRPIGHGVVSCYELGTGGIAGSGLENCIATYTLPLGKVTAQGLIHSRSRYTLAITGGTGAYSGAGGTLFTRRVGPGVKRIIFSM